MEEMIDPVESYTGSDLGRELLRPIWQDLQDEALAKLDNVSIEDLCRRARDSGVMEESEPTALDFAI